MDALQYLIDRESLAVVVFLAGWFMGTVVGGVLALVMSK